MKFKIEEQEPCLGLAVGCARKQPKHVSLGNVIIQLYSACQIHDAQSTRFYAKRVADKVRVGGCKLQSMAANSV
jgi:hypothetical protein